jgi:uncharacterized coiled-coil protein SlyX
MNKSPIEEHYQDWFNKPGTGDKTPWTAWIHQQAKIDALVKEIEYMEKHMADAICNGKDNLKKTIYELNDFIQKNLEEMQKLEAENEELKERLNGKKVIGSINA